MTLPSLPPPDLLAERCRESAAREKVPAAQIEKDFYLPRLLWALGASLGAKVLLKGGTLLSKVDLGFRRMSEDVDLVLPGKPGRKRDNAIRMKAVRAGLKSCVEQAGVSLEFADGERHHQDAHVVWNLPYASAFGRQAIVCEVSIRPALLPPRQVHLNQLLDDPSFGDYSRASCWALDATEARAEKVRAAFTRTAIRDFFDLAQMHAAGMDLQSVDFQKLIDRKLLEIEALPLAEQPRPLGMTPTRRSELRASLLRDLPAVLRVDAPPFDFERIVEKLDALWTRRD